MRVVLFAWCPTSVLYLEALAAAGAPPALVVTGARTPSDAPLARACDRLGVPLARRDDPSAPDLVAQLVALPTDLLLVAGCARVLGPELLAVPRVGALNFHPGKLPAYRGKEPLFWAILRGEPLVAVTVHHLTGDVDGGPVLFQRAVAVPPRATSASLAALVDAEGAALVPEILALARAGALPSGAPQSGPPSHFPPLRAEHGVIDFTRSTAEIDRLVRAADGEIAACFFFRGMRVIVREGEALAPGAGVLPGRVAAIGGGAIDVAATGGAYRMRRLVFMGREHDGAALAAALGIAPGDAFSASPAF